MPRFRLPERTRPLAVVALSLHLVSAPVDAAPSAQDLRMAGECSALGTAIMQNRNAFRESRWHEAGFALMLAPMVLAGGNLDVPFKSDPAFKGAHDAAAAELAAQPASPDSPAYASRIRPCLDWADTLAARPDAGAARR